NRSSRLALPFGPSNSYFFSTVSHGIRRRSAAIASRARVKAFSFTRSCWRAASHSCGDTTGGVFIGRSFKCSILSLLVLVVLAAGLPPDERGNAACRADACGDQSQRRHTYRTHHSPPRASGL